MKRQRMKGNYREEEQNKKLQLENEVALGQWIQFVGQVIELKGVAGLYNLKDDVDIIGEEQILTGIWIKTIGQLLAAISVSNQIGEKDLIKLLEQQKITISGDFLSSVGSAYQVLGGVHTLRKESAKATSLIP